MNLAHTPDPLHNCNSVAIHRSFAATIVRNTARPTEGRHKSSWPGKYGEADIPFCCPKHRAEVQAA
jgi:hypothetical protein